MPPNLVVPVFGWPRDVSSARGAFFMLTNTVELALGHHQAGRLAEASQIYRQVLAVDQGNVDAWYLLAVNARQVGNYELAVTCAVRALELRPEWSEAHFVLGKALQGLERLDEAIAHYRETLRLDPNHASAYFQLGNAFRTREKVDEAIVNYRRALELKPNDADAHNRLGHALRRQGKLDQAVACFARAGELKPESAEAFANLGNTLREQGKLDEAATAYAHALELNPDLQPAHAGLGAVFQEGGNHDAAMACFQRALALKPDDVIALCSLGNALKENARTNEAIACFRRALELHPDFACAYSNLLYTTYFCPDYDAATIYEEHRRWNEHHSKPLAKLIRPHTNEPSPSRRLRIGYVSPDFRNHCQAFFIVPLFRLHDHEHFEILCYSSVLTPDDVTAKLQSFADGWRDIVALSDDQAAELIRQDRIDILVDLSMHMGQNRNSIFARKAAPVQVCWFAYPGTTGLTTMDYRLTDPYLDPPGLFDRFCSERSVRLPDTFWCYDPLTNEPAVNSLPALDRGYVTFGCLNNFCKVNTEVVRLWARILQAVHGSRLMLRAAEGYQRQQVLGALEQAGVATNRITFVANRPRHEYLQLYHEIDIGLDTFPYNGHTTSLDSFWMGVPVVTIVGQTAVGRGGLSQLSNLGLREIIAETPEQFIGIAADLASNLTRLRELRGTLRNRMQCSPLMDAPQFARDIESAYREMWRGWCAAVKPSKT